MWTNRQELLQTHLPAVSSSRRRSGLSCIALHSRISHHFIGFGQHDVDESYLLNFNMHVSTRTVPKLSLRFSLPILALLMAVTVQCDNPVRADELPASADEFARSVLDHEVAAQSQDNALWSYRERKLDNGERKLLHVYQTSRGEIERLVELSGHPLTPTQVQAEDQRIEKLISNPGELRQRQKKQHEDAEQARNLLRMFPDAFFFQYDGRQGSLVRLKFTPNPKFDPPNHAAQVFHHMTGAMLLDPQQKRLAAIDGELTSEVKFFGGIFGHLDKGGIFTVRQEEVSPGLWEVTAMHVHMNGKALLFKIIEVQEDETYSDFRCVPSDTTLSEAAALLKQDSHDLSQTQAKN
jgi:hypothetical protein